MRTRLPEGPTEPGLVWLCDSAKTAIGRGMGLGRPGEVRCKGKLRPATLFTPEEVARVEAEVARRATMPPHTVKLERWKKYRDTHVANAKKLLGPRQPLEARINSYAAQLVREGRDPAQAYQDARDALDPGHKGSRRPEHRPEIQVSREWLKNLRDEIADSRRGES